MLSRSNATEVDVFTRRGLAFQIVVPNQDRDFADDRDAKSHGHHDAGDDSHITYLAAPLIVVQETGAWVWLYLRGEVPRCIKSYTTPASQIGKTLHFGEAR